MAEIAGASPRLDETSTEPILDRVEDEEMMDATTGAEEMLPASTSADANAEQEASPQLKWLQSASAGAEEMVPASTGAAPAAGAFANIMVSGDLEAPPVLKQSSSSRANARASIRRLSILSSQIDAMEAKQVEAMRASVAAGQKRASQKRAASLAGGDDALALDEAKPSSNEPEIKTKEDIAKWLDWATKEAKLQANLLHPTRDRYKDPALRHHHKHRHHGSKRNLFHRQTEEEKRRSAEEDKRRSAEEDAARANAELESGPMPLNCTLDEMMSVLGCGVRLYFDFLLYVTCIAVLGILSSIPSFIASLSYIMGNEYDQQETRCHAFTTPFRPSIPKLPWFTVALPTGTTCLPSTSRIGSRSSLWARVSRSSTPRAIS